MILYRPGDALREATFVAREIDSGLRLDGKHVWMVQLWAEIG